MTTPISPTSTRTEEFREGFLALGLDEMLTSPEPDEPHTERAGAFVIYSAYTPTTILSNSNSSYPEGKNV